MSIAPTIERPQVLVRARLAVPPWKTVMALAVVLAYADGFWLTSLRGAVGAIERTQSPFASWWQEATLVLPVFVLAVLGALTLAMRWFGPVLRRSRGLVVAGLLVVAAATLVGIAQTVASAAYDYHLQTHQMQIMDSMRSLCQGSCLAEKQHATLLVHIHGVLYISGRLLVTNLVLVAWLVAMWGGRLRLSSTRPARATGDQPPHSTTRHTDLRRVLIGALVGAAAIHVAVVPEHLSQWSAAGIFFLVLAIWELAVAGLLLARLEQRAMLLAAAAVSLVPLGLWLGSRSAGLPFGPEAGNPEASGLPDLACSALELVSLVLALVLLHSSRRLRRPAMSAHVRSLALVALVAITAIGFAGVGLSWFDAFGISGVEAVTNMPH
jgi:hypothetical protein